MFSNRKAVGFVFGVGVFFLAAYMFGGVAADCPALSFENCTPDEGEARELVQQLGGFARMCSNYLFAGFGYRSEFLPAASYAREWSADKFAADTVVLTEALSKAGLLAVCRKIAEPKEDCVDALVGQMFGGR